MVVEAPRLARPRGDVNKWGAIVNKFLRVAHNEDGTLKLESVFGTSIGTGLLLDGTVLKTSAVLQKYHAIDPSVNVQTLLGAADFAAFNTLLGLGTGDSPTFAGATITGCSVLGLNSAVFKPTTDSTTFGQFNDKDGNVIVNVDTVNGWVGIGTVASMLFEVKTPRTDAHDIFNIVANDGGRLFTASQNSQGDGQFRVYSKTGAVKHQLHAAGSSYFRGGNFGFGETNPETLTEWTHAQPYMTWHCETHTNDNEARKTIFNFKGEKSDGGEHTLARQIVGHDGTGDDEKGYLDSFINTGSDGDSPTHMVRINSVGVGIGTATPLAPLEAHTLASGSYNKIGIFYADNLTAGEAGQLNFGKAGSNGDSSEFRFVYQSADHATNRTDFGFYGHATAVMSYFNSGDVDIVQHDASSIGLKLGGTLVTSSAAELNLLDGTTAVQEQGDVLDDLNTLGANAADSEFLVGTGAGALAWESGATARTSLGLGTGDTPTFANLDIGSTTYTFSSIEVVGSFAIKTGGDNSDYLYISTVGDVPVIGTVGSCDLKITASSGEIDFDNENLTTIGTLASGVITQSGTTLANTYQPLDAGLTNLAAVAMAADKYYYTSADNTHVAGTITSFARTILDDVDAAAVRTTLGVVGYIGYIKITDTKAQNTNGGDFDNGAWRTRVLTTEDTDTGNDASLSSNQITLSAGTYECSISSPGWEVGRHQIKLYNTTGAADILIGTSGYADLAGNVQTRSFIVGRFTIAAGQALEVQHQCQLTSAAAGLGIACNFTSEVYTIAEFWRVN